MEPNDRSKVLELLLIDYFQKRLNCFQHWLDKDRAYKNWTCCFRTALLPEGKQKSKLVISRATDSSFVRISLTDEQTKNHGRTFRIHFAFKWINNLPTEDFFGVHVELSFIRSCLLIHNLTLINNVCHVMSSYLSLVIQCNALLDDQIFWFNT